MAVRITKPEFNLREKLTELDYSRLPIQKMPATSIIQTQYYQTTTEATTNNDSSYVSIGLYVNIKPLVVGSTLEVSACIPSYSNNPGSANWSNALYLALYHTSPDNETERRIAMFEHPGPKTSMEFVHILNPVYYMTANYPGNYLFNWRVKLVSSGDTHYFGRTTDSMATTMNTVVREIIQ